jgi:hypothetical protein
MNSLRRNERVEDLHDHEHVAFELLDGLGAPVSSIASKFSSLCLCALSSEWLKKTPLTSSFSATSSGV